MPDHSCLHPEQVKQNAQASPRLSTIMTLMYSGAFTTCSSCGIVFLGGGACAGAVIGSELNFHNP